jgi:hypothetical protein
MRATMAHARNVKMEDLMKRTWVLLCCVSWALAGCGEEGDATQTDMKGSSTAGTAAVSEVDYVDPRMGTVYVMNPNRRVVLGKGAGATQASELPGGVTEVRSAVNSVGQDTDWSGRVQTQVVECASGTTTGSISVGCSVSPEFVLVGGGAQDVWSGAGAMLWESHPQDVDDTGSGSTWLASSKDHVQAASHSLHVWAIGLRVKATNGLFFTKSQLKKFIHYGLCKGQDVAHEPHGECAVFTGLLIGGGARANWKSTNGAGQLLVRSVADHANSTVFWNAIAKDHVVSDPATIDVFAIAIEPTIRDVGTFAVTSVVGSAFVSSGVASASIGVDPGTVATCFGGDASHGINGRMLFRMSPADGSIRSVTVSSKDHIRADSGTTTAAVTEISLAR